MAKLVSKTDRNGHTTAFAYDQEGRLVKETDPLGGETIYEYDEAGRLVSKTDQNGHQTSSAYDAAGQKISVTAPDGSITSYEYDLNGNVISRKDANGHETTYVHDAAGRRTEKVNPLGSKWTYRYDPNGNLIETVTAAGNATLEDGDGTISQSYDSMDRPVLKSYSDGTPSVSYSYDKAGRKISMTDGQGTTLYAYDAAGHRIGASGPQGAFLYRYDSGGNLVARTYPNNLETAYAYNDAGEMISASVKGRKTFYTHDAEGKLASTLFPSGLLETRAYDAADRLGSIETTSKDGKLFSSRLYARDAVGNPLMLTVKGPSRHAKGWWSHKPGSLLEWKETYTYDQNDRLTKACMNARCSRYFAYSYDPVGNRTKLETRFGETTYAYDEADELLSVSKGGRVVESYTYDLNGNQAKDGSTTYAHNLENKLTEVKKGCKKKVSYAYSGDGLMVSRSNRNDTTTYAWDTRPELAELALETDSKSVGRHVFKNTIAYTYGEGAIGQIEGRDEISFHTDALGSVVALSDERGKLIESYRYSPYGQDYSLSWLDAFFDHGENESAMRFTGQYLDLESDLYYMRARNYAPETGRFMQTDPLTCETGGTCASTYSYADDSPTVMVDPRGEGPMVWGLSGLGGGKPLRRKPVWVTFYSTGQFTHQLKVGAHGWWAWEKISTNLSWRICWWRTRSCNGVQSNYWAYDESKLNHSADDIKLIKRAAEWAWADDPSATGYVFVAPTGKGWEYKDPPSVKITRHFIEAYNTAYPNPDSWNWRGRQGGSRHEVPTVAVLLQGVNITRQQAGKWVWNVCATMATGQMGIYADPILDNQPGKIREIERALNACTDGKKYTPIP